MPRPRGEFVSDLYGVLLHPPRKVGLLAGFLAQRQMFGRVHAQLRSDASWLELVCPADGIVLGPSASLASDWACLQLVDLTEDLCLDPYLLAVAEENGAHGEAASPTGWCSWYQFFARVQNDRLTQNEAWIAQNRDRYPLQVIQLDDGYEAHVGDWERTRPEFGVPLDAIGRRIAEAGGTPGLWIAPFVAAHNSRSRPRPPAMDPAQARWRPRGNRVHVGIAHPSARCQPPRSQGVRPPHRSDCRPVVGFPLPEARLSVCGGNDRGTA